MGGLPCAKAIIDQGAALNQTLSCMNASILLSAPNGGYPTDQMEDEFVAAANKLAEIATRIEKYVRESGGESYDGGSGEDYDGGVDKPWKTDNKDNIGKKDKAD